MDGFGQRLRELRESLHITQKEFALRLGVNDASISNLERGKREPSEALLLLISKEFSVEWNWLVYGTGDMHVDITAAYQKEFARLFMEITIAFAPVYNAYGGMMKLFSIPEIMDMYNYIAYCAKSSGYSEKKLFAIAAMFDTAFPGYRSVVASLTPDNEEAKRVMGSTKIAQKLGYAYVSGAAAAGMPILDQADEDDTIAVPSKYLDASRYHIFRAVGDSMEPRIPAGSCVVVQCDDAPADGEIAVVRLSSSGEDEYVIKRVYRQGDMIELRSINAKYPPRFVHAGEVLEASRMLHLIAPNG